MGIFSEQASWREGKYAGNYVYKNGDLEFFNTPEGYVEHHADGFKYIYQYKDHLGNIRLSYNKGGNRTFLNDTFDSSTDGWGGGGVSATNGRLGVKVRYMYSGTNKKITQSFSAGETIKIKFKLDANGKGYKMRVLVNEIDAANASTGWYSAGDAPEGTFEATYQIKQDAAKLNIKLGLTSSIATEEEIYLDDISVVQETEEGIIVQQEKNYYPFGLEHKGYNSTISGRKHNYGYNGIELNEDVGLYEMDLRQYDPAIARWTAIDPVTHHSMSTYNGFDNNPVFFADPSGSNSIAGGFEFNYHATGTNGNSGCPDGCPDFEGGTLDEVVINSQGNGGTGLESNDIVPAQLSFSGDLAPPPRNMSAKSFFGFENNAVINLSGDFVIGVDVDPISAELSRERRINNIMMLVAAEFATEGASEFVRFPSLRNAKRFNYTPRYPVTQGTPRISPYGLEATHGLTLSKREFSKLKADIAKNGITDAIPYVNHNGTKYLVGGHHRVRIAKELGLKDVPVVEVKLPYAGYKNTNDLIYTRY